MNIGQMHQRSHQKLLLFTSFFTRFIFSFRRNITRSAAVARGNERGSNIETSRPLPRALLRWFLSISRPYTTTKIFRLLEISEQCVQSDLQQSKSTGARRHIQTQMSGVQTSSPADVETFHLIRVVADKDERRARSDFLAVGIQANVKKRIAAQNFERGAKKRIPLSVAEPLSLLAPPHDVRVKSQTGIVNKYLSVDLSNVNFGNVTGNNRARRFFEVERNVQVFGEMIERAERQYAENLFRADQFRRDCADCAVAAARDNRLNIALAARLPSQQSPLRYATRSTLRINIMRFENISQNPPLSSCRRARGSVNNYIY